MRLTMEMQQGGYIQQALARPQLRIGNTRNRENPALLASGSPTDSPDTFRFAGPNSMTPVLNLIPLDSPMSQIHRDLGMLYEDVPSGRGRPIRRKSVFGPEADVDTDTNQSCTPYNTPAPHLKTIVKDDEPNGVYNQPGIDMSSISMSWVQGRLDQTVNDVRVLKNDSDGDGFKTDDVPTSRKMQGGKTRSNRH